MHIVTATLFSMQQLHHPKDGWTTVDLFIKGKKSTVKQAMIKLLANNTGTEIDSGWQEASGISISWLSYLEIPCQELMTYK